MRLADYRSELQRRLKDFSSDTQLAIDLTVNNLYYEIWNQALYWFARRELTFNTIAPYSTGTIIATNLSATISGVGTTFTKAMEGRKLVMTGDNRSYKIKTFVSTTQMTLETIYLDDTKTTTYNIYKDIYTINDRVEKVLLVRQNYTPMRMGELRKRVVEEAFPFYATSGTPTNYCPIGQTDTPAFNTGTVSVVSGSANITGSSACAFDSTMIDRVFKVVGDDNEYLISSVASVSAMTLKSAFQGTTVSAANYEVGPAGIEQIQLLPMPDKVMQVKVDAIMRPIKLLAANDVPELPQHWQYILLEGSFLRLVPTHLADSLVAQMGKTTYDEGMLQLKSWHGISEDELPAIVDRVGVTPMNKDYKNIFV